MSKTTDFAIYAYGIARSVVGVAAYLAPEETSDFFGKTKIQNLKI